MDEKERASMCMLQEMFMIDNTFGSRLAFVALLVTFSLQRLTHAHTQTVFGEKLPR